MILDNTLNTHKGHISKINIPEYITDNLAFELREYQKEALARFLYYSETDIYDTNGKIMPKQPHLLWQMATGSGKTLIMAALILEMYKRGFRNFWFFVTSKDIITKTLDNFTNSAAKKYQFARKIEIDGNQISIKKVDRFSRTKNNNINIKFSTINILHQISRPETTTEDSIGPEDIKDIPLVLIGDESHHLNASTKKEREVEDSWENSVKMALKANHGNYLFEFTATANLTNAAIAQKYEDKLIYNFDLKKFRENGYSKDIFTEEIDISLEDIERIMLRVILMSQYRKHIASDNGIDLKPVILFKSEGTTESEDKGTIQNKINFDKFNAFISKLDKSDINKEFSNANIKTNSDNVYNVWYKTINYFKKKNLSDLADEIKRDFDKQTKRTLIHDGKNKKERLPDQMRLVSTLEESDNPVRAIFAVNMLQEGWDVLNLFDIVRLYDKRDGNTDKGNYIAGNSTISEAQLIGRGARYYPFKLSDCDKYKRKFDNNENEPLRVLEQMHYHCKTNPKYIYELRQTLINTGAIANNAKEIILKMKQDFISGKYKRFQNKKVFVNRIYKKEEIGFIEIKEEYIENEIKEQEIELIPNFEKDKVLEITLQSEASSSQGVFENE